MLCNEHINNTFFFFFPKSSFVCINKSTSVQFTYFDTQWTYTDTIYAYLPKTLSLV